MFCLAGFFAAANRQVNSRVMENLTPNSTLSALVVGSSRDQFVGFAIGLLGKYGFECDLCGDLYAAVARLANVRGTGTLVIGRLGRLSAEKGRLFRIAAARGIVCCCLADGDPVRRRKQVLDALQAGAYVISDPEEVGRVVAEILTGRGNGSSQTVQETSQGSKTEQLMTTLLESGRHCPPSRPKDKRVFIKDECLMTKQELDALLGA